MAGGYFELTDSFIVSADLPRVWDFFSRVENLRAITPSWLSFTVHTAEPVELRLDGLLDYTIRWMGIPIRWRTKIIDWQPPRQFIDLQVRGPYTLWHHQHSFTETSDGVECRDRVIYKVPLPVVGRAVNRWLVRRQLREIFLYRRTIIGERLGWVRAMQDDVIIRPL